MTLDARVLFAKSSPPPVKFRSASDCYEGTRRSSLAPMPRKPLTCFREISAISRHRLLPDANALICLFRHADALLSPSAASNTAQLLHEFLARGYQPPHDHARLDA